ncbi:hypothetical protein CEP52_007034 [Fusarium oligoseptatum]|uniref:Uncharacterized protein n=1 Tax=Fusarium oligoseptatum TaxID=2604345 RepID=A0A428TPU4_9HYPO|nr:hypothetical protein CEP52_007034 [Fusarium oligoseptatum]
MTPRMPRDTGIPSDVPKLRLPKVSAMTISTGQRLMLQQHHVRPVLIYPQCRTSPISCRVQMTGLPRKKTNNTAIELLNILNMTVAQRFEGDDDDDKNTPKVHDLFKYRDIGVKVCTLTRELVDYMQQVVQTLSPEFDQGTPAPHPSAQWAHKKTREALTRLHDVAPFITEVAVVRLCEMSSRAERGVAVMQETEQRLGQLRQEITKAIEDGWLAGDGENTTYLHFPSLTDIQQDWAATQAWLRAEADDVIDVYQSRHMAFNRRRGDTSSRNNVIWSRWGLKDARRDPMGTEALCWEDGVPGVEMLQRDTDRGGGRVCGYE